MLFTTILNCRAMFRPLLEPLNRQSLVIEEKISDGDQSTVTPFTSHEAHFHTAKRDNGRISRYGAKEN
jgi:hypothetical protein